MHGQPGDPSRLEWSGVGPGGTQWQARPPRLLPAALAELAPFPHPAPSFAPLRGVAQVPVRAHPPLRATHFKASIGKRDAGSDASPRGSEEAGPDYKQLVGTCSCSKGVSVGRRRFAEGERRRLRVSAAPQLVPRRPAGTAALARAVAGRPRSVLSSSLPGTRGARGGCGAPGGAGPACGWGRGRDGARSGLQVQRGGARVRRGAALPFSSVLLPAPRSRRGEWFPC